jgi:nucleoside-diphosphate-sugar epimerase
MRILITGGSGFIGSNLLDHFIQCGINNLLSLDIIEPVNPHHLPFYRKCDILDLESLNICLLEFNPDYIIHLAAKADLKGNNLDYYKANTTGVENVLNVSASIPNLKKIIFTSTMLVCKVGFIPQGDLDYCPPNLYGQSKQIGEQIVREQSPKGYNWVIVRPSSIWGPGFGPTYRTFFEFIQKNKYYNFSGKMSTKTYGYIENVTFQIEKLLFSESANFGTFYLGDYDSYNIKEWSIEIAGNLNKDIKTIPTFLIYFIAIIGDILSFFNLKFPMSTFRYKNMVTSNILPMENTKSIIPILPVNRKLANIKTIHWMRENGFLE